MLAPVKAILPVVYADAAHVGQRIDSKASRGMSRIRAPSRAIKNTYQEVARRMILGQYWSPRSQSDFWCHLWKGQS
jgi:hypothetical protein